MAEFNWTVEDIEKAQRDFSNNFMRLDCISTKSYDVAIDCMTECAKKKAADVQPVDRWISVDDRLPEEIGYYLVVIGNEMLVSIDIAEYSENRWHKHDEVLYWQPLPDYPKAIKG